MISRGAGPYLGCPPPRGRGPHLTFPRQRKWWLLLACSNRSCRKSCPFPPHSGPGILWSACGGQEKDQAGHGGREQAGDSMEREEGGTSWATGPSKPLQALQAPGTAAFPHSLLFLATRCTGTDFPGLEAASHRNILCKPPAVMYSKWGSGLIIRS